ncbi:MAG: transcription initiation protein [Deltaproteobacteria bacterium]|nr:transcription initiation protein [Deltaproteobacteria bacterium]
MKDFLFLYRFSTQPSSPEEMQKLIAKWNVWMLDLIAKKHVTDRGHPLERAGKLVQGKARAIVDGPYAETKDIIGGYTPIVAKDLDEAAELAKGCPVLESGGLVEVRPIMKL